jgi:hypothetical protein
MGIYEKSDTGVVWTLFHTSLSGRSVIEDWRSSLTVPRQADFDVLIRNMIKKVNWVYSDVGALSGKRFKGLYELRWRSEKVPHRIGGYFSADDEFVMLIGWTHNAKKYDPPSALETLLSRRKNLKTEDAKFCVYPISTSRAAKK